MKPDVKNLAQAHALEVLGIEQYKKNPDAVQALAEDFTAGWNAALATQPAPLADAALAELEEGIEYLRLNYVAADRGSFGTTEVYTFKLGEVVTALPGLLARLRAAEVPKSWQPTTISGGEEPTIPVGHKRRYWVVINERVYELWWMNLCQLPDTDEDSDIFHGWMNCSRNDDEGYEEWFTYSYQNVTHYMEQETKPVSPFAPGSSLKEASE
jgi:hypothetical protein